MKIRRICEDYLNIRRKFGYDDHALKYTLRNFVDYLERIGESHIRTRLAIQWVMGAKTGPASRAHKISNIRCFAKYAHSVDSGHEIPPPRILPGRIARTQPYIFSEKEVIRLIEEAGRGRKSKLGFRPITYSSIVTLIAVTGMRSSEPLALNQNDVDLVGGVLHVHKSKFGKSRLIPVHRSTRLALRRYARQRDALLSATAENAFFLTEHGRRPTLEAVQGKFVRVTRAMGIREPAKYRGHWGKGPRLHDLRHTFAVRTLLRWYRDGVDVDRQLPKLSTYLGHSSVQNTYWYLTATPELVTMATRSAFKGGRR